MAEEFGSLDAVDAANLESARAWLLGHFTERPHEKYEPISGKLRLLDAILASGWVEPSETQKLQAMGVGFGDAIAQKLLLNWVVVDDDEGRTAALNWPGSSLLCYPITMISKRIEAGEAVDVHQLFEATCDHLTELVFSGRYV